MTTNAETPRPSLEDLFGAAVAAQRAGDADKALGLYENILGRQRDHVGSLYNSGIIHRRRNDFEAALANWARVIALEPGHYAAHMATGRLCNQLDRLGAAADSFNSALASRPGDVDALTCLGNTARAGGQPRAALRYYDQALSTNPDHALALASRGYLLAELGAHEEAVDSLGRALRSDPTLHRALGARFAAQLRICDWSDFEASRHAIRHALRQGRPADRPWTFLLHTDDPAEQRNAAEIHARETLQAPARPLWSGERYAHDRLRVAYVSSDFRAHAITYLMAETLRRHDPARFEVFAYALGPRADDAERREVAASVPNFFDVSARSDLDVARMIRTAEIDVLVDLNVYTTHARPQIFAHRCAPLQINYLGYPGTSGARCYDYVIADGQVIPHGGEAAFSEQVIRLPHSYQASPGVTPDEARADGDRRADGLPVSGFVFCCFNGSLKLTPDVFRLWMDLLNRRPDAVLWLLDGGEAVTRNLRAEALRCGVDPDRLVFAPPLPRASHLARHRCADLFLDTWPYNAHTTANDALRMGLPVVTFAGRSFAARVAASLLHAVGLPELVTDTPEAYAQLATELAEDPARLAAVTRRLRDAATTSPLFDARQFTRDLEDAYLYASARAQAGEPPAGWDAP